VRGGPREAGLSVLSPACPAFSLLAIFAVLLVRAIDAVMLLAVCGNGRDAFHCGDRTVHEVPKLLRESAFGEAKGPPLCLPAERDALHEPLELEIRRLRTLQNGLDDVGRQEDQAEDAPDITRCDTFDLRNGVDRRSLARE